jgi:hypothetical protein
MGIPSLAGVSGSNKNVGSPDRANALIVGTFAGVGPSAAFTAWGPMNVVVWGELSDTLTTTKGSTSITAASGTSVSNGDTLVGANIPPGATVFSGGGTASLVAAFMPQFWAGNITNGSATISIPPPITGGPTQPADLTTLIGATILNSPYFPSGTTILAASNTTFTLTASAAATSAPPPAAGGPVLIEFAPTGNAIGVSGADSTGVIMGPATPINLTLQLERSFDGGKHWIACGLGGDGTEAQWALTKPLSLSFGDPEAGMLYRLNCLAYTGVANTTVRYRMSTTGQASVSLQTPAIS